jgi:hypothetical protein
MLLNYIILEVKFLIILLIRVYGGERKNGRKLFFFACRKFFFAFCVAQNAKNVCDYPVFANWRRKKFEQSQKLFPSQISSKRGQMKSIKLTYDTTILEIYFLSVE